MENLDDVASLVYLIVAYHSSEGKPFLINVDLKEGRHIKEVVLKYIFTFITLGKKGYVGVNLFNLDARKQEVSPILNEDFEFVQLDDNPSRSFKIGYGLSLEVKSIMIKCLWENMNILVVSSHDMYDIEPTVAFH